MSPSKLPRSVAVSWYLAHHSGHNGYKKILVQTKPPAAVGFDELQPPEMDR